MSNLSEYLLELAQNLGRCELEKAELVAALRECVSAEDSLAKARAKLRAILNKQESS